MFDNYSIVLFSISSEIFVFIWAHLERIKKIFNLFKIKYTQWNMAAFFMFFSAVDQLLISYERERKIIERIVHECVSEKLS